MVRLTHPLCFLLLAGEVEKLHSHFPEFIATWVWRKSDSITEAIPWGWEADPKAISLALLPVWAGKQGPGHVRFGSRTPSRVKRLLKLGFPIPTQELCMCVSLNLELQGQPPRQPCGQVLIALGLFLQTQSEQATSVLLTGFEELLPSFKSLTLEFPGVSCFLY